MNQVQQLAQILLKNKWQIATAESCTGGLVAANFTELAGSSDWFERGYVTYSNQAKIDDIHVPKDLILSHGAVSTEVAEAMALGVLKTTNTNVSLSITGIAGPTGGSIEKPVGFVCFAWAIKYQGQIKCISQSMRFIDQPAQITPNTRQQVRVMACEHAITRVVELLKDY